MSEMDEAFEIRTFVGEYIGFDGYQLFVTDSVATAVAQVREEP